MRILAADDTEEDRYLLKILLESHGHEVVLAENGKEALEAARRFHPDVIISDILMPVKDGYAFLYELRHEPGISNIPVIFNTGTFTQEDDRELALKLGVSRFLLKPTPLDQLVKEIETVYHEHLLGLDMEYIQQEVPELDYYKTYSQRLLTKLEDKLNQVMHTNVLLRERSEEIRRQSEENSRLLEEARTALKTRESFLAVAAHEVRTPLTSLKGWVQLTQLAITNALKDAGKPFKLEKGQLQLQKALSFVRQLERLIDDMSDTTEVTVEERLQIELQPVDLHELLEAVISDERFLAGQHHLSFEVSNNQTEYKLLGDANKLRRAIANLLDNALKFSPDGGNVKVKLEADVSKSQAVITISDEGIGIADEEQDKLFKPYYQAESNWRNRRYSGLGLGLFVTKAIIDGHSGEVAIVKSSDYLKSHPESGIIAKGTTSIIRLPLIVSDNKS